MIIICDNHNIFDILKSVLICDNMWTKKTLWTKEKDICGQIRYLWNIKKLAMKSPAFLDVTPAGFKPTTF